MRSVSSADRTQVDSAGVDETSGPPPTPEEEGAEAADGSPSAAPGSTVERYSGAPLPSRQESKSGEQPPSSGEPVSAAELGLRASSDEPSAAQQAAMTAIRETLGGWVTSDEDVEKVRSELEKLGPRDFKRTLDQMNREGLLQKWADEMEPEARRGFIDQCVRKGLVSRQEQPAPTDDKKPVKPPEVPSLYLNRPSLPAPVRELIHSENKALASGYQRDREDYKKAYADALEHARSPLDIRKLGMPEGPRSFREPGLGHPDSMRHEFEKDWSLEVGSRDDRAKLMQKVNDRLDDLAGRQRRGTFKLTAGLEIEKEMGAKEGLIKGLPVEAHASRKFGHELSLTQYGDVEDTFSTGVSAGARIGGAGRALEAETGVEVDSHGTTKGTVGAGVDVGPGGGSIALGTDGSTRMELDVVRLKGSSAGSYSGFNSSAGTVEGGVTATLNLGVVKLKGSFGMAGQLSNRENAKDAARMEDAGIFGPMPELDSRTAWDALPPERRERLERTGWNKRFWEAALKA